MPKITRDSLMTLEGYAKVRPAMRAEIMAHKKNPWSSWATTSR